MLKTEAQQDDIALLVLTVKDKIDVTDESIHRITRGNPIGAAESP